MKIEEIVAPMQEVPFVKLVLTREEAWAFRDLIGQTKYNVRQEAIDKSGGSWSRPQDALIFKMWDKLDDYLKGNK